MSDAVITGADDTQTLATSQVAENQKSEESRESVSETVGNSTVQSGEDYNAPVANSDVNANAEQADTLNTPQTTNQRSIARFRDLANKNRELVEQLQQQQVQEPAYGQVDPAIADKVKVLEDVVRLNTETQLFDNASREVPEMKDPAFDNAVYAMYKENLRRGEFVHPIQIAKDLKKLMDRNSSKIAEQVEQGINQKSSASVALKRSDTGVVDDERELETIRTQITKGDMSSKLDAMTELLKRAKQ